MHENDQDINALYTRLDNERQGRLDKARLYARATIPGLLPDESTTEQSNVRRKYPHSSLPARGVVEWGAKMTTAIIPLTEEPFLGIELSSQRQIELEDLNNPALTALTSLQTKKIQDIAHREILQSNARTIFNKAMQHLAVVGDVIVHQDGMDFSMFRVDNFVIERDSSGEAFRIIIRKYIREHEIPEDMRKEVTETQLTTIQRGFDTLYPFYIALNRDKTKWDEKHFIGATLVKGSESSYDIDVFPYFPLQYNNDPYENWSDSIVEQNYGDIISLHAVRETLLEALAINNIGYLGFVPGNLTPDMLKTTPNWGWVPIKDKDSINVFQPKTIQTISTSAAFEETLSREIRRIFLMDIATEFTQDRVTAFQISQAMQALERASGGTLSSLRDSGLKPMANVTLRHLTDSNILGPELKALIDSGDIVVDVKSGIDSIGNQTQDAAVLEFFAESIQVAPESISEFDIPALIRWRAKQKGMPQEIFKTAEQKAQQNESDVEGRVQDELISGIGPATSNIITEQARSTA